MLRRRWRRQISGRGLCPAQYFWKAVAKRPSNSSRYHGGARRLYGGLRRRPAQHRRDGRTSSSVHTGWTGYARNGHTGCRSAREGAQRNGYLCSHANAYTAQHSHANANVRSYVYANAYGISDFDSDSYVHLYSNLDADIHQHANRYSHLNAVTLPDTNSDFHFHALAVPDSD